MRIELKTLKELGACSEQVELFEKLFGDSVEVTEELCLKHAGDFNWNFARQLLSGPAWAEYDKVCGLARAEYDKVCGPAWAKAFNANYPV